MSLFSPTETIIRCYGFIVDAVQLFNSSIYRLVLQTIYGERLQLGANIKFNGLPVISIAKTGILVVGDNVIFTSSSKFNMAGINKPVTIAVTDGAKLIIGKFSGFSGSSIYCSNRIDIGAHCNFGVNTFIWDTDFHSTEYKTRRREGGAPDCGASKAILIGRQQKLSHL